MASSRVVFVLIMARDDALTPVSKKISKKISKKFGTLKIFTTFAPAIKKIRDVAQSG